MEKTGLRIPTAYLYKKFSIPEPEAGEEIAGAAKASPPTVAPPLPLKSATPNLAQEEIDKMAEVALFQSKGAFAKSFAPVVKLFEKCKSLEALRRVLEDEAQVSELLGEMEQPALCKLLQKSMLYANLAGRCSDEGS